MTSNGDIFDTLFRSIVRDFDVDFSFLTPQLLRVLTVMVNPLLKVTGGTTNQKSVPFSLSEFKLTQLSHVSVIMSVASLAI